MKLGPLSAEVRRRCEEGLGYGLAPCSQERADELERLLAAFGTADEAVDFIAATCRRRDTKPDSLGWLVTILGPVAGAKSAAP
jgi:hypothetical protein